LKEKTIFYNNLVHGNYYCYDEAKETVHTGKYINGIRYGIAKTLNKDGNLLTEILYIDDIKIRWKAITTFESSKMTQYDVYDIDSSGTGELSGYYYVNNKNEIIDSLGYYYFARSDTDTIKYGSEYKLEIQVLVQGGDTIYGRVLIGELNNKKEIIDSTSTEKLEFGNKNMVTYSTKKYKVGDNLLLGKILVTQDTVIDNIEYTKEREFLLYKDFYVKK